MSEREVKKGQSKREREKRLGEKTGLVSQNREGEKEREARERTMADDLGIFFSPRAG